MEIERGRVFVRAWPAGPLDVTGKAAIVGVAEITGCFRDEIIHDIVILEGMEGVALCPTGSSHPTEYDVADHQVESVLTSEQWRRPSPESGMDGGGLFLRRVRGPASTGTLCIVAGLLSTDALRDQTMLDLKGSLEGSLLLSGETCVRHLQTNGATLSQILNRPIWGWDTEPWGLRSTMAIKAIDACIRYEKLLDGAPEDHPGEMESLSRGYGGSVMGTSFRDDDFSLFKRKWREKFDPMPRDGIETAAQQEETSRRAMEIIREMEGRRHVA